MSHSAPNYPEHPTGAAAERFIDPTVTHETAFRHQRFVEFIDPASGMGETVVRLDHPGDGFELGRISHNKHAGPRTQAIVRTSEAKYIVDTSNTDTFVRLIQTPKADGGFHNEGRVFEASVLGDGISGRIGGTIMLPGASVPEKIESVDLRYKMGIPGQETINRRNPFLAADKFSEHARQELNKRAHNLGRTAL